MACQCAFTSFWRTIAAQRLTHVVRGEAAHTLVCLLYSLRMLHSINCRIRYKKQFVKKEMLYSVLLQHNSKHIYSAIRFE